MNFRLAALALLLPLPLPLLSPLPANAKRPFDVRDLAGLERVSDPVLSADGRKLVLAVRQTDFAANKGITGLWIEDLSALDSTPPVRLTEAGFNVNSPSFSPDGATVYFLSAKSGSMQLWSQPAAGGSAVQLSNYPVDIGVYKLSPNGKSAAISLEVFPDCANLACTKARLDAKAENKASGVLYDKLFVRHWDAWADGRRSQLFTAKFGTDGKLSDEPINVSRGIDGDIPSKPFGDATEFAWSPDGKSIAFNVRIAGKSEAWSTNFDIYLVPASGRALPRNLTVANRAWDAGPVFSADGKTLYYRAMKRPGFEADRFALMAMDLGTGKSQEIAAAWDRSADTIVLSGDGKTIYTQAQDLGRHPLFAIDIATGTAKIVAGDGAISAFALNGDTLAFVRESLKSPGQLFVARADGAEARQVSVNNLDTLKDIVLGDFEQFSFPGWNGETVYGHMIKPANYKPGRKYPVAFLIHGGPQSNFNNTWSYRWNPQVFAGQGFAVVMIDFHGSNGYGQAFTDSVTQHWGDRPLDDLQKGWAAAQAKYPFLDGKRACALGGSYGGYMVNWIAGHWPQPWKCLVNHDGIFDTRMMGYSTEELWFTEWENGGTPYQAAAEFEKFNPANHVDAWRVPMLVVQGQLDHRVPLEQGLATFTALQRKGIESQFLTFPDENHWVLKPANSVLWNDTVIAWLKLWTK
jgi:dipeptidyl aminopeptidase/acylaminoacyl peptidase